jgi:hypothetical protein
MKTSTVQNVAQKNGTVLNIAICDTGFSLPKVNYVEEAENFTLSVNLTAMNMQAI